MVCAVVGEQRRDRSVSWGCWQRKIFIRVTLVKLELGVMGCVCVRAYVRVHTMHTG